MSYDRRYQTEYNGPLTATLRRRIIRAKDKLGLTLAQTGTRFDFSGPFLSQLLREEAPARMRTKHVERLVAALAVMEREAEAGASADPAVSPAGEAGAGLTLEDIVRAAHRLGFEVSFKPLTK